MYPLSSPIVARQLDLSRIRRYTLVFLATSLSCTVVLKVAEIQYLEWIFLADVAFLVVFFCSGGGKLSVFRPYWNIATSFGLFLVIVFLFGLIALQQDFFLVGESWLKKPLLLTISRMGELFLDVFYALYLASLYRVDLDLCAFGAKVYYWVGIAGGIYSFATYPLNVLFRLQLGTYNESHRMRGFNNEGGGFGAYIVSVIVLAIVMRRQGWLTVRQFYCGITFLAVCLIGSQSKSGFLIMAIIGAIDLFWLTRGWKRWAMIGSMLAVLSLVGNSLDFGRLIDAYVQGSEQYQRLSNLRRLDGNFVMGKVSGAVLAPRMIAEHPWIGIGWGNYPLVRDDPSYRQGTAFSLDSTDAPGLGPIDYVVELGLPLWLYLTWIELKPVYLLRRYGADPWLMSLAMILPVSNWTGSHLNLTHPWVVLGLALGIGFRRIDNTLQEALPDAPSGSS